MKSGNDEAAAPSDYASQADGRSEIDRRLTELFGQCERFVMVRAPRLESDFFRSEDFQRSCQRILLGDLSNRILFLLEDEDHLMRSSTRLLNLARKFSSYVKIKLVSEEYVEHQDFFVVGDGSYFLHQPHWHMAVATAGRQAGVSARLSLRFKELWERSVDPPELLRLGL